MLKLLIVREMSQNKVSPQLLKKLADYGLRGFKDSSFDLINFYFYQDAVADYPDFNLIVGTEAIFIAAFESGATGSVCGMANIFPQIMKKMYDQYNSGDKEAVMETQRLILKNRKITKLGPTIPIMHCILRIKGIDSGYPRKPYINIDSKLEINIQKELEKLDLN